MNHIITNDLNLDAVKDNYKPPMMSGEFVEGDVRELFSRLGLSFVDFFDGVKKNGEYFTDSGIKSFYIKDVASFIKLEYNISL